MIVRRSVLVSCIAVWTWGLACAGLGQPPRPSLLREIVRSEPAARARGRSLGYPWDGRLVDAARLRESRQLRYLPATLESRRVFGTRGLVRLLERTARGVARRWPGSKLTVGDLSGQQGGDIGGHRSHESGRDADIAFFTTSARGRPFDPPVFLAYDRGGRGLAPNGALRFDDARNWQLVSGLLSDPDARVQYIFVARALRARLLREAVRSGAPKALRERAATVLVEPTHGDPHRSHFHVRIYCAQADRPQCLDAGPYWAWYPGTAPRSAPSAHAGGLTTSRQSASPVHVAATRARAPQRH